MQEPLLSLAPSDLRGLAAAIASGRLTPPFSVVSVKRYVNVPHAESVTRSLQELAATGIAPQGLTRMLELLADGLGGRPPLDELVDLVTTAPDTEARLRGTRGLSSATYSTMPKIQLL